MSSKSISLTIFLIFIMNSCATKKNIDIEKLYNTTWQLEYITGPRIAFNALYPDKKPKITFDKTSKKVTGTNSCNGYVADYYLTDNLISFGESGPRTLMYCGEGENVFLEMMKKINKFRFNEEDKLILMLDDVAMMRFKKVVN